MLQRAIAALVGGLIRVLQCFPLRWLARLGRFFGAVAWVVDGRHRRVALENLRLAFGAERSEEERRAIAREHFRRLGENYVCALKTSILSEAEMRPFLEFSGMESLVTSPAVNRVVALGHLGNFELYTRVVEHAPGWTVASTYRALRQPRLNEIMQSLRTRSGVRFFERRKDARALFETLSKGRVILGLLADQHAGDKGVWLPFFGKEASCSAAPAVLALRHDSPVWVMACFRVGLAKWRIEVEGPIAVRDAEGRPRSVESVTRDVQAGLEAAIRKDPANWFWVHRRWKERPKGAKGEALEGD